MMHGAINIRFTLYLICSVEELTVSGALKLEDFVSLSAQKLVCLNDGGSTKVHQIFSCRIKHTGNNESQRSRGNRTQRIQFQNFQLYLALVIEGN